MLTALRVHRLAKYFEAGTDSCRARVEVLRDIDLVVGFGEAVAVTGSAGCGKTTLVQCVGGLLQPTAGSVFRAGPVIHGSTFEDFPPSTEPRRPPTILIWDDPFSGLPRSTHMLLKRWLRRARECGHAVLITGRAREEAELCGARAIALEGGRLLDPPDDQEAPRRRARIAERLVAPNGY